MWFFVKDTAQCRVLLFPIPYSQVAKGAKIPFVDKTYP